MKKDLNNVNEKFESFIQSLDSKKYNLQNIKNAYEFAKKAHVYQRRKSGEPFICHPLAVAEIVYSMLGLDESSIIAALLHDVAEDTEYTLKDIKELFGEEVMQIVNGLTKIDIFDKAKGSENIETLRKILLASAKDIRILLIKLSDRLHNMRTMSDMPAEKKERISKETLLIYAPIAQKIGIYSLKWELEDLSLKYIDPETYAFLKSKLKLKREEREEIVKLGVEEIKTFLKNHKINQGIIVLGRPKNFYSIYKKIKNKTKEFDEILDLYAIRIITKDISQCYLILGLLHEHFQSFPNKLKDYIANPKSNGYQSLHTVIFSKTIKSPVEIQIRTEEMHKLAEFGIAAHWKYKNIKEDKKFDKKISWLREVLQWEKEHKDNQEFLKLLKYDFFEDEIFVFTPKSDILTLPESSTALDFAYAVHTDIGNKAVKCKINGIISTIDKILKSGDIVNIITQSNSRPQEKWLHFVKTSKARSKIRDALNIKHSGKKDLFETDISFDDLKNRIFRIEEFKKIRKAGCCNIIYGDHIVGVISKEKELVVHNASCENSRYTLNKKIQLSWKKEKNKKVTLIIDLKEKYGLLIDVLNIFTEFNLNISNLNTKVNKDGSVHMEIKVLDGPYMESLQIKLKELDNVESVKIIRGFFS